MKKIVLITGLLVITSAAAMNQANRQNITALQRQLLFTAIFLTQEEGVQPLAPYNNPLPQPVHAPQNEKTPYQQHQRKPSNPYTRHRNNTCNGIRVSPHHFGPTKHKA